MPWEPQAEYLRGLVGVYADPDATARLNALLSAQGQSTDGSEVCQRYGLFGSGAGKLSAPFRVIDDVFPGSLPASAQARGDCVAHSTRNAILGTLACEVHGRQPDEVTGKVEGVPNVSEAARKDGVLSTEAIYWWRRHGGDGWSCDAAAEVALRESGLWLRQDYPGIADLTRYSGNVAGKWGAKTPPDSVKAVGQEHLVRTATHARTFEEVRDLLANGYCLSSCGSEAFSNKRDDNGVSKRASGVWYHAMALLGADDRDETKTQYGEPLVMVQNSWGRWNTGGRKVLNSLIEIPEGGFWARWSDIKNRYCVAFSGVMGWPAQTLPDWGLGDVL